MGTTEKTRIFVLLFSLLVLLVVCYIAVVVYQRNKSMTEGMSVRTNIVFIGDSQLNNENYVPANKSVPYLVTQRS